MLLTMLASILFIVSIALGIDGKLNSATLVKLGAVSASVTSADITAS
jgi:hypothetical protein